MSELLNKLASYSVPMELIVEVAKLVARVENADMAIEARRKNDKDRQQRRRQNRASRDVTLCHVTKESTPPNEIYLTPPAKKITPLTPQFDFASAWNEMARPVGLPICQTMSRQRKAALRQRLADFGEDGIRRGISAVGQSAFCKGDNDRNWLAGPDFVLQEKSLTKLLEGQFSTIKAASSPADERKAFLARKYG
jgi:hypothetical protein